MNSTAKQTVKFKLRKGDEVIVIAGKNKGRIGKIDRVDTKRARVFVGGVNIAKRHTKPSMANQEGGIVDKVMSLDVSNVMLVDPKTRKPTRIGYKMEDGKKVRIAKGSGVVLA